MANWQVLADATAVAEAARQRILTLAEAAISRRGRFSIVLAGGTTPAAVYRMLVSADTDWSRWHIYLGDERCLPADDPQRNSVMAAADWLSHVAIPPQQIHMMAAELGPEAGASAYESIVEAALPFDLVLLGLGEDGHTASLFPGHKHPEDALVVAVFNAPKAPPERISLNYGALGNTRELLFLVTGAGKQQAVRQWQNGADLPAARITTAFGVEVLADAAAMVEG